MRGTPTIAALALAALGALDRLEALEGLEDLEPLANLESLSWSLPPGARIDGSSLIVELAPGSPTNAVHCETPLDLSGFLGDGLGLVMTIRLRAEGVTKPAHEWNGVKFMLRYEDADTGRTHFPGASVPIGTYGWRTVTNRVNILTSPVNPVEGRATLVLGLQESTGRVEFDLDSLTISTEEVGVAPVNQDWIVRYPPEADPQMTTAAEAANDDLRSAQNDGHCGEAASSLPTKSASSLRGGAAPVIVAAKRPLRGCMLPHGTTEDDIATLASWGATLVRFQIARNWTGVDDNQDLDEYAAWVDSRLDNLEEVLSWCAARGMKVCVDLHTPPGGKRAGDRAMNMFFEEKFADAFVETWRRIAARCAACAPAVPTACAPALQSAGPPAACAPALQSAGPPAACAPALQSAGLPAACAPAVPTACAPALQSAGLPAACAPAVPTACAPALQSAGPPAACAPALQSAGPPAACAPALQSAGPLYGYDLVNEPIQRVPAPFSYWELQRRAAEAIREIDPSTAIIVESNLGCVAESYRYLSPLAMDNVIYQVHLYKPYEYTHQGVWGNPREEGGRPLVWPDPARGWTQDHLRRVLAPVRAFQEKHHARIYVGEFSAVSWAPGAEYYLRDCIALFAEYGWDWTYHAFREWGAWSVEHEAIEPGRAGPSNFRPVTDTPRKRALLEGFEK